MSVLHQVFKAEFFDRRYDFICMSPIETPGILFDYLTLERFNIKSLPHAARRGDFIVISGSDGMAAFQGIVYSVKTTNHVMTTTVSPLLSLLDIDVPIDRTLLQNGSVENFIATVIHQTYAVNSDSYQTIPGVTCTVTSSTFTALNIKSDVHSLWDICSRSLTVYDVAVEAKLDVQARQLHFTIGAVSGNRIIEADLPNCLDKTFTITDTFGGLNKVTYINKNDENQRATFYLYTDGSIGTDDRDRITPVFFKYEYIQSSDDFYATAASRAAETLTPKKHNNLIELTYAIEDKLVRPSELQIGQTVEILHDGITYSSMLTGWERTDNLIHLVFGSVRLDLTKILELERRNGNAS